MKRALIVLVVLAMAVPAFAGQNPDARVFVTFAMDCPDPYVHYTAATSGLVNCYMLVDGFGDGGGMSTISLQWTTTGFGMAFAATYYLPGAQVIGGPDHVDGLWVIAGDECVYPNACGVVAVLNQPYFVSGAGTIVLSPNDTEGLLLVDCNVDVDEICVLANGGLGMEAPEGSCEASPVEDATWGSIKSLYR